MDGRWFISYWVSAYFQGRLLLVSGKVSFSFMIFYNPRLRCFFFVSGRLWAVMALMGSVGVGRWPFEFLNGSYGQNDMESWIFLGQWVTFSKLFGMMNLVGKLKFKLNFFFQGQLAKWGMDHRRWLYGCWTKNSGTPKWISFMMENPMNKGVFPCFWVDTHMMLRI